MSARLVFSYLAFSTPQQSDGRSTDRQESAAKVWADAHGFTIAPSRQYCDEGVSRFHGEARMKGALSRFLALCRTPAVPAGSILVVEDFDRLSRECPDDAWELFRQILLAEVEIFVLSMDRWFRRDSLNDLGERFLVQACQHRAHNESVMKSKRVADIWADRRRRAAAGRGVYVNPPSWIRRNADGALELVPERAETLRLMVRLIGEGLTCYRVAAELTRGPNARPSWLKGGGWDSQKIQHMLKSPALWGGYQPHRTTERRGKVVAGELVEGFYPAVLSRAEGEALLRLISTRRKCLGRPCKRVPSVLSQLVRDAETAQPLWRYSSGQGVHRYFLGRRVNGKPQCVAPYLVVEELVLRAVQKWAPDALSNGAKNASKDEGTDLLAELGRIAADRDACAAELARPGRAASTAAIFARQLDALDARESEVKERLADLAETSGGPDLGRWRETQSLASQYKEIAASDRPAAAARLNGRLREILDGVWIYRRNLTPRRAEVIIQVWARSGAMRQVVMFHGKPPADYQPSVIGDVDFRTGYPSPLSSTRSSTKSAT